jgi:hypothetical protein
MKLSFYFVFVAFHKWHLYKRKCMLVVAPVLEVVTQNLLELLVYIAVQNVQGKIFDL